MNVLRQSADNEIVLQLGLDVAAYPTLSLRFCQNGAEVLRKTRADCVVEGNVLRLKLRPEETARLSPQRFALELVATSADGDDTVISEEITGMVARSKTR